MAVKGLCDLRSSLRSLFALKWEVVTLEEIMAKHKGPFHECRCDDCSKARQMKEKAARERKEQEKGRHGNEKKIPPGSDYTIEKGRGLPYEQFTEFILT
jgi:hypothetical protein